MVFNGSHSYPFISEVKSDGIPGTQWFPDLNKLAIRMKEALFSPHFEMQVMEPRHVSKGTERCRCGNQDSRDSRE